MKGWKEIAVGELGRIVTGNTPPRKNPEFYGKHTIFIKPTDISEEEKYTRAPEECYSDLGYQKYKSSLIPKGSTCVVTIGSIGKKMTMAHTDCFINQAMNAIIPNDDYDKEFVYYLLKYNLNQLKALDSGTASGRENVSKSSFSSIKLLVPVNRFSQQKIGFILSSYDSLIENNQKRIKLLQELARRTYEEWFVKFNINGKQLTVDVTGVPAGWKMVSMLEIADFINGFAFKPTDWQSEGMPIIKIKELKNNIGPDTPRYNGNRVPQKLLITSGDILFSWSGSLEVAIWQDEDGWLNQHLFKVVPKEKESRDFVHQALLRSLSEFNSLTTGATMKHIKRKELDFVQVAKPPIPILREFEKIVKSVQNQILNIAKQTRMLKESRDILLPRLMSGEIDVEKMSIAGIASKNAGSEAKTIPFYPIKEEKEKLVAEATDVYDTKLEKDKWQFKEAVLIAVLTHKFSSEKYPLGRKRYTKLSYLFHRHAADQIARYARKAAGPYNPGTKYGGPEKIAQQNKYIVKHTNGKLEGFVASDCIADAYPYFQNYWSMDYLNWMDQFRYKKNDELELYATVDNAMIELYAKGQQVNVEAVKSIIKSEKEWAAKLEREIFSDTNIQSAIFYLPTLYAY